MYTELEIGRYVCIENVEKTSSFVKTKWRTWGWIKEILSYEQYVLTVQGTNADIKRNRKHIRPVTTGETSSQTSASSYCINYCSTRSKGHELHRATSATCTEGEREYSRTRQNISKEIAKKKKENSQNIEDKERKVLQEIYGKAESLK